MEFSDLTRVPKWIWIVMIALLPIALIYNHYYHKYVRSCPVMYPYETYMGPSNNVLVIENLKYKDSLLTYYNEMSEGENPVFNFPLKDLPKNYPVYVIDYTEDSLLAEVVSYFDRGPRFGGAYLRCYVDARTLHMTRSADYVPLK